ncbi:DUF6507 family protein [Serinibacter salmoneus]|uniref:Uncharacterized protein n=1 Tax=Serinibacter salmoneus TaxID=556530 RepID=A0A2A9D2X2_9MICO|nr:DUF6507 family protein [Serinibacter salmoneus]PFG21004.1 hypothetical protein ATL40_2623 [Serinibacter salmoneus]
MTSWQIAPEGVQAVLESVGAAQEDLTGHATPERLVAVHAGVQSGAPVTQAVHDAMGSLLLDLEDTVLAVMGRINAGRVGVYSATTAYQQGQLDMAAECQGEMSRAADSGDLSYFLTRGYIEAG